MKKINHLTRVVFILIAFVAFLSCETKEERKEIKKQDNTVKISGEIKGMGTTSFFMRYPDNTKEKKIRNDSIMVIDGKFSFTDSVDHFMALRLFPRVKRILKNSKGGGYYPISSNRLLIFIYPGADVKIKGEISDFVDAYPSGDPENELLAKLHKKVNPFLNEIGDLMAKSSFEEDKDKKELLIKDIDKLNEKVDNIKKEFIADHLSSKTALYYLEDMITRGQVDEDKSIELFGKIDPKLSDNIYYKNLKKRIAGITSTKAGQPVPVIKTTSTLDGKEFNLESYRGKYVMIDFWGTWCAPCVGEMPHVKEFLAKHKDQMEVLGVNYGDTKKRLQTFLNKNDYPWQQVIDVKGEGLNNFVAKFNVTSFPTKFIISPDGKILMKYVGDGNEPFEYLESLFSKS
ncbi:MAG: AhpC/TSA family protein [Flavobacteriaceae bacterium]|nr:AhpC/TSA family protein [Flavobacteriaceae bacterium]